MSEQMQQALQEIARLAAEAEKKDVETYHTSKMGEVATAALIAADAPVVAKVRHDQFSTTRLCTEDLANFAKVMSYAIYGNGSSPRKIMDACDLTESAFDQLTAICEDVEKRMRELFLERQPE